MVLQLQNDNFLLLLCVSHLESREGATNFNTSCHKFMTESYLILCKSMSSNLAINFMTIYDQNFTFCTNRCSVMLPSIYDRNKIPVINLWPEFYFLNKSMSRNSCHKFMTEKKKNWFVGDIRLFFELYVQNSCHKFMTETRFLS